MRTSSRTISHTTRRRADREDATDTPSNPILEEYKRNNPELPSTGQQQLRPTPGDISKSSIFEDERRAQLQESDGKIETRRSDNAKTEVGGRQRNKRNMLRVLDPDPNSRERWERKKVIQTLRRGGRLNKTLFVKRTEREHLAKSHNMKTSVKKLGKLARQIAGKTVDDAITQMRFSKKKVATEVLKQLEAARDEAVVMRGMGLGQVDLQQEDPDTLNESTSDITGTTSDAAAAKSRNEALDIQLKSGKRHQVTDRSKIYIDQAWVGRGPYGKLPDYRAKGRVNLMRTPFTSISLLLKEEATRVREWEEREARRKRQRELKVWVPLPDRPIQTKSQWYSW